MASPKSTPEDTALPTTATETLAQDPAPSGAPAHVPDQGNQLEADVEVQRYSPAP
tara:strand:- start:391 stop:555 length:165 start_codon:yes stop_codon:yes gene_type:complete